MTSEDVIPLFISSPFRSSRTCSRVAYTSIWFEANKTGDFPIFCAEFCGVEHSDMMMASVIVHGASRVRAMAG